METNVDKKFKAYPKNIYHLMIELRNLIFDVAKEESIGGIEETLKWGEPSYLVKGGSTVRIDWKPKYPQQYCMYFNCKTTLIETFREIYSDVFVFEGNRAIVFKISEPIPKTELKHCISMALRYHKIKHLPLLGA